MKKMLHKLSPECQEHQCGRVGIIMLINRKMQAEIIFHTDLFSQCKMFSECESRPLKDSHTVWHEGLAGSNYCQLMVGCLSLSVCLPCKSDGFFPLNSFPRNSGDQRQQLADCHQKSDFMSSCTGTVPFPDFCLTFPHHRRSLLSLHHVNVYDKSLMQ